MLIDVPDGGGGVSPGGCGISPGGCGSSVGGVVDSRGGTHISFPTGRSPTCVHLA